MICIIAFANREYPEYEMIPLNMYHIMKKKEFYYNKQNITRNRCSARSDSSY